MSRIFFNSLKNSIIDGDNIKLGEGYCEWEINNWYNLPTIAFSPEYEIYGYKWKFKLYKEGDGNEAKDYISLYLFSSDAQYNRNFYIKASYRLYIRNYNKYNCYELNRGRCRSFNYNSSNWGWNKFIKRSGLYSYRPNSGCSIMENCKLVIGAYIRIYKVNKDEYINEIKKLINDDNCEVLNSGYYEYPILNWNNTFNSESPEFNLCGYKWKLKLERNNGPLSIHLDNINLKNNNFVHLYAKYILVLRNSNSYSYYYPNNEIRFFTYESDGYFFIEESDLFKTIGNTNLSIIDNDKTTIGIYIRIYKYGKDQYMEDLKHLMNKDNFYPIRPPENDKEIYFEWNKNYWGPSYLGYDIYSEVFNIENNKWKIHIIKDPSNYIFIELKNENSENDNYYHIKARCILTIRNSNDYSYFYAGDVFKFNNYGNNKTNFGWNKGIDYRRLLIDNNYPFKTVIKNNNATIGAYIYFDDAYEFDFPIFPLSNSLIEQSNNIILKNNYYEWNLNDWKDIIYDKCSPVFERCGHKWQLQVYPNGRNTIDNGYTSLYLNCLDVNNNEYLHINTQFLFFVRNSNDRSYHYIDKETISANYNINNNSWGNDQLIRKYDINKKNKTTNKSLCENNQVIFGVSICSYIYGKEEYLKDIKQLINNENHEPLSEGYYEWQIDNSDEFYTFYCSFSSPEFYIGNCKWEIELNSDRSDYLSANLELLSTDNDDLTHVYAKCILSIRNCNGYSYYYTKKDSTFNYYNKYNPIYSIKQLIKKSELKKKDSNTNKSLIENNKFIIGVYIRTYKYYKDQYIEEIESLIKEDNNNEIINNGYYEWKINDWNKILEENMGQEFIMNNQKWKVQLNTNSTNKEYISVNLENLSIKNDITNHIYAKCSLVIRNYNNYSCFYTNRSSNTNYYNFCKNKCCWNNFIKKEILYMKNKVSKISLVENNKIIIGVFISTINYNEELYINELKSLINDDGHTFHRENYYEWKIENWNELFNGIYNQKCIIGGYRWNIQINPDNTKDGYISFNIKRDDIENDINQHVYAKFILTLRNYYDYSNFYTSGESEFNYYNKNDHVYHWSHYIRKKDLYGESGIFKKSLVENNKIIIGVYVRIYKYEKELYIEELKRSFKDNNNQIYKDIYNEWGIINFSKNMGFNAEMITNDKKWKILLYSNKQNSNYLSIDIKNMIAEDNNTSHICSKCIITLYNSNDYSYFYMNDVPIYNYYNKFNDTYSINNYIEKDTLFKNVENIQKSLVEYDKTNIGVYIRTYEYEKEQYIEEIKSLIKDENHNILNEGYYEWKIEDWKKLSNEKFTQNFIIGEHKWNIEMDPIKDDENISICLNSYDAKHEISTHIYAKCLFIIRNYNNYSCFYTKGESEFKYYNKYNYLYNYENCININELIKKDPNSEKFILEDNKTVIGVYIRIYEYNEEQYHEEIKELINDDNHEILKDNYYEWVVENWDYNLNEIIEHEFSLDNYEWKISLNSNKNNDNNGDNKYISALLKSKTIENDAAIHIYNKYLLIFRNCSDYSNFYTDGETKLNYYNQYNNSYYWDKYIKKDILFMNNNKKSLIKNNKFIIGVHIRTYKYEKEQYIEDISHLIKDNDNEVSNKGYYECLIENWNEDLDKGIQKSFDIGENKWKIKLRRINNENDEKYIYVQLKNNNIEKDKYSHICSKSLITFCNYNDYSYFYTNINDEKENKFDYYSNFNICNHNKFIKQDDIPINNEYTNKSLIENDKIKIGIYMHEYKYKKEQYYEELKSYVIDYNHEVLSDGFYEWKIKNWSQLLNDEFSDEFEIGGYKWKILLNPNGYDNKVDEDYISVYLKNIDVQKNSSTHIYANCLLAIRNYKDCSCFFINNDIKSNHYNKYNNSCNWDHFIKRECLYEKTENSNRSIIEDDEVVIDIYIRIYKYNKVQYIHELESLTINKNEYDLLHDNNYYEWQIEDWNNLENEKSSDEFLIGNSKWKLCLYSDNEDKNGFASFYLKNMDSDNTLSHVCAKCILVIRNYEDYSCFYSKESEIIYFNKYNKLYGWKHFIKNKDLFKNNDNTNNSLIKNNKTVVGAYIFIYKYEEEQYNEELKRLIKDEKYEIDKEGYFEWEINEWNKLLNDEFNKEFNIGNQKWKLSLNPNGFDDKADNDSVTIELKNINIENVISTHLCSKCILTIRNYNDLSTFCVKRDMDYDYFDQDNSKCEWKQFIKKSDLFKLNEISNKPIIENNIAIIGVYIRTYKYIKEQYVDKIKNLIEDDGYSVLKNDYYEWEIEKIDNLNNNIEYSPEFEAAGHQWKMLLYPNGSTEKNEDYLSIYLKNLDVINNETSSTSILSKCVFSIHNNDYSHTYLNKSINFNEYNSYRNLYGIEKFINKDNLLNINSNSENQKIIIGAYIRVYKNDEDDEKLNNNKGWKEVHMICKNGSTEQLEKLIRLGYHLSEKTKDGWYPLHIACQNGKIDIVKFLIENDQGIDINLRSNGETPIEIACSNNYYEIVDYLLDKEANLIYLNSEEEYKLLHIATINNNIKMVKLLLNKGKIQIHSKDPNLGWTALHIATKYNYHHLAKYLIRDEHADVNEIDHEQNTPLHISSQYGHTVMTQLLISNKADINYRNSEGWTPVHIACQYNHENIIQLLIDNNANYNLATYKYWTPLHISVYYKHFSIVKYLLSKINNHLNIYEKTIEGLTVFNIAKDNNNPDILKLLNDYVSEKEKEKERNKALLNNIINRDIMNLLQNQYLQ